MSAAELTKVGRYEILAKVGQGAMGVVYRAQDPTIRRIVALKVLPAEPAEAGSGTFGTRGQSKAGSFEREAQAAGALLHPNIVTLYDAGRDGNWYYLAMEFVEGGSFATEIMREGKVKPERAAEVAAVVADALDFAHERGVIHRDIKPANLMILSDQTVKVADFGIARLTSAATMTSDTMVGTPYYMSPEQVRGGKIDGRSDLFSLGVVLYEALTGRKPFQAETLAAVLNSIINSSPPPPHEIEASIPRDLSAIVERAMARKPEERYTRGKDMASELRRFLDAVRGEPTAAPLPAKKSKSGWLVAVAAAIVALVALGGALLVRGKGGSLPSPGVGYLEFVSEPVGAEIFLDGSVVGRTPYTSEVTAGKHEIEFRKDGYFPATQSTTVEPNKRVTIELPMLAR
ncbi:MAG TPA: serine/threonine-protein kinase [Candidatus Binatia bacterium]|nr:serine/threonine-protein kinase [Candidatus Binatia bacterium]